MDDQESKKSIMVPILSNACVSFYFSHALTQKKYCVLFLKGQFTCRARLALVKKAGTCPGRLTFVKQVLQLPSKAWILHKLLDIDAISSNALNHINDMIWSMTSYCNLHKLLGSDAQLWNTLLYHTLKHTIISYSAQSFGQWCLFLI